MRFHLTPSRNNAKFWDFVANFEIEIEGETIGFYDYAKTLLPDDFSAVTVAGYTYTQDSIVHGLVAANAECVLAFPTYTEFSAKFWDLFPIASGIYIEKLNQLSALYSNLTAGQVEKSERSTDETAARSSAGLTESTGTDTQPNVEVSAASRNDSHGFERTAGTRGESEIRWSFRRQDIFGVFEMAEEARYDFLTAFDSLFQTLILI